MTQKKLFLLDAMALIYRAHFAFIRNPRINSKGLNTSAIFGFTNSLLEIINKEKPTHIAVVSDSDKPTFRHDVYKEYKAQREVIPEDILAAKPYIEKLIEGFRIPLIVIDTYEADDIIGTLAYQAAEKGFDVYMMTPDKDFCQLVKDNIFIYKPAKGGNDAVKMDVKKVLESWEIEEIDQVRDILGLMGDASDNIPGVPKVGEKTAKSLIKEFKSIENLLENTDKLKGKLKENVENNKELALLSKDLVTIKTDVPVTLDEEALKLQEPDSEILLPLFNELEFKTVINRVFGEEVKVSNNSYQGSLFDDPSEPAAPETETIKDKNIKYKLIDKEDDISSLANQLNDLKAFTVDTETTGLSPHLSDVVGVSFSFKAGEAFYVPVNPGEKESMALQLLKKPLENPGIEKTGQNIKYDMLILKRKGIDVKGKLFDTMLAHFIIDPESRHNMDILAQKYLNYTPVSIESLIGKKGKDQANMKDLSAEKIKDYACEDADVTLQLAEKFKPVLKENKLDKLYYDIEAPLIHVLTTMEFSGVKVDKQVLNDFSIELAVDIEKIEKEIYQLAGIKFNINSPKQLGEVLFVKLRLDPNAKKTRKSKQFSTGEDVLSKLAVNHEIASKILDYRSLQKLKSTYVDALPELIHPETGRIHTSYNQAIAATGRLSSTNPNLQNIPIRTEKGKRIRAAFVPVDDNHLIFSADYSQVELRLFADMSGDEGLIQAFNEGQDIHAATAAKIYDVPLETVSSEMRRNAKTVNFGIIYGISAFGLAERLGTSRTEAAKIIEQYFTKYPGVKKYMNEMIELARKNGYAETKMGRKRMLRDINSKNNTTRGFAERNAINTPIQGTAAEMIKIAMINIHDYMLEKNMQSRMILQVHDELVFDMHKSEEKELSEMVIDKMKNAMKLKVPVVVDTGFGNNWLEAH